MKELRMVMNAHARDRQRTPPHRRPSRAYLKPLGSPYIIVSYLLGLLALGFCIEGLRPTNHHQSIQAARTKSQTFSRASSAPSVIVNEVAWGGTEASAFDEWIELYNVTGKPQSLEGWTLVASDGSPDIQLSGEIPAYGYFVIERTDDDTIRDRPAELITSFGSGLNNNGEQLNLIDPAGDLIDTANGNGGPWPNEDTGASPTYRSMERIDPRAMDLDTHWQSNDRSLTCGQDADGNPLNGTPGAINAAYYPYFSQHSDLAIASDFPAMVQAGDRITAYIDLLNRGGLTATQVTLTASLPPSIHYEAQKSERFTFNVADPQTLIWHRAHLHPDTVNPCRITLTLRMSPALTIGTKMMTRLSVTTTSPELRNDNNIMTASTTIQGVSADLILTKTGMTEIKVLNPPELFTYHLSIHNRGPDVASGVWITDRLPGNLRLFTQTSPFSFTWNRTLLTWHVGDLSPDTTYPITLTTTFNDGLTESLTNRAGAKAATPDPEPANNQATWRTQAIPTVLISSVLYDGYAYRDADEAVGITNMGPHPLSLRDWELCKDRSGLIDCEPLPAITVTESSEAWITKDAEAFAETFGFAPKAQMENWLGLTNTGDEALLRNPDHQWVDTLVYGAGTSTVPGWSGDSVKAYYNFLRGETGQILHRISDERTGLPAYDTDTCQDWIQTPEDAGNGRRVLYPGWDMTPLFFPLSTTETASTTLAIAPDHGFEFLKDSLERANHTIFIEVYTLRHPDLIATLAAKAAEGVEVKVLLEGSPVGLGVNSPEWQTELHACGEIEAHGGEAWFMIHRPEDRIYNRYSHLHPKMIIIDEEWLILSTQNLTYSSLPSDDKRDGTAGTRGAIIITNAPSVVQRATEIMTLDLDPQNHADLLRWNQGYWETYGPANPHAVDLSTPNWISYTPKFTAPLKIAGDVHFELFTAPEAALRQTDALLGLIRQAGSGDSIDIEQTYEHVAWGEDPILEPNLRLQAYLEAAHRGAHVRILLNGQGFIPDYDHPPEENLETVAYVKQQARVYGLNMEAAVGNPTGLGIHNKMVLVDLGEGQQYVHLGSINGSETSSKVNREIAIQLRSDEAHAYYLAMFEYDWWSSHPIYLPIVTRNYQPPAPPVDHLVISEVYYAGPADAEWVEIFNPTDKRIDLSAYRLGDAEAPDVYESMFHYPPGVTLEPEAVLVIAVNGLQTPEADLEFYEHAPDVPNMIPDPDWGDTRYPFALRNLGDQVLLLGSNNKPVDVVIWGDAKYPYVSAHPGVINMAASLSRQPAIYDTDNCGKDFVETYPSTPGEIPKLSHP